MSLEEVKDLVKPANESLQIVHEWLLDHDIEPGNLQYSAAKDWVKVSLDAGKIESLLNTKYSVYKNEAGSHLVRTQNGRYQGTYTTISGSSTN